MIELGKEDVQVLEKMRKKMYAGAPEYDSYVFAVNILGSKGKDVRYYKQFIKSEDSKRPDGRDLGGKILESR